MLTNSRLKNETSLNNFNLSVVPSEFPITGIFEFFKFNFFNPGKKSYHEIHPLNLTKKIEDKLYKLCVNLNWYDNHTIIKNLNLPHAECFRYSPFNFKYVYEYVAIHKTRQFKKHLDVEDTILLKPVNQKKFKAFYSI